MVTGIFQLPMILCVALVYPSNQDLTSCGDAWCLCSNRNKTAICQGHGTNLSFIPKLPAYVKTLEFTDNFLPKVSKTTFQNISSLRLQNLKLTFNKIGEITETAFNGFSQLTSVQLDGNIISPRCLVGALQKLSELPILTLSFKFMHLKETAMFRMLHFKTLKTLLLDKNNFMIYNQSHFSNFQNLKMLSLRNNRIQQAILIFSPVLQHLDLRNNHLLRIPTFCFENKTLFPNLQELHLDHNLIMSIPKENIHCLKHLVVFSLNYNHILKIKENTFSALTSLRDIILRNLFNNQKIDKYAFKNSNVEYITLSHSAINFKKNVHIDAFKGCSNIKGIDVSGNVFFRLSDDDMNKWFGHLTSLTGIGFGNTRLKSFPNFIPLKLPNLKYLKLYSNHIKTLPVDAFSNLSLRNLTHLWLGDNLITMIDENVFPVAVRQKFEVIDLQHNPFACNCELLWFLHWTKQDSSSFTGYPEQYVCDSPDQIKGRILSMVDLTKETCIIPLFTSLIIIGASGALLTFLIISSVIYKWRWHIRYYVYAMRHKPCDINPIANQEFEYDAYVIYGQENVQWIKNELITCLEEESGLKLYIRDRDSLAGTPIVDNVVSNMAISRSVLIVLSNAMARDELCQFELMFVQRQNEVERSPIILVLLEEVKAVNMTPTVYALVKMNSYISWVNEFEGDANEIFWNRLKHSLNTV